MLFTWIVCEITTLHVNFENKKTTSNFKSVSSRSWNLTDHVDFYIKKDILWTRCTPFFINLLKICPLCVKYVPGMTPNYPIRVNLTSMLQVKSKIIFDAFTEQFSSPAAFLRLAKTATRRKTLARHISRARPNLESAVAHYAFQSARRSLKYYISTDLCVGLFVNEKGNVRCWFVHLERRDGNGEGRD